MSGYTKSTIIFSIAALLLFAGLTRVSVPLCALPAGVALGLAAGYVGAYWQKDEPSKTARIARNSGKVGLVVGAAAFVGLVGGILLASGSLDPTALCTGVVAAGVSTFFGWLGGWSWARQEHERQTGYKPT